MQIYRRHSYSCWLEKGKQSTTYIVTCSWHFNCQHHKAWENSAPVRLINRNITIYVQTAISNWFSLFRMIVMYTSPCTHFQLETNHSKMHTVVWTTHLQGKNGLVKYIAKKYIWCIRTNLREEQKLFDVCFKEIWQLQPIAMYSSRSGALLCSHHHFFRCGANDLICTLQGNT
jgi:hypothetical protein